jgi:hypothetical protein
MRLQSMRLMLAAACFAGFAAAGLTPSGAQSQQKGSTPAAPHSTGETVVPDTKGPKQPQGHTGPLETTGKSAPAESPQGQTPPGMHAAPEGSSKTTVEPKK